MLDEIEASLDEICSEERWRCTIDAELQWNGAALIQGYDYLRAGTRVPPLVDFALLTNHLSISDGRSRLRSMFLCNRALIEEDGCLPWGIWQYLLK